MIVYINRDRITFKSWLCNLRELNYQFLSSKRTNSKRSIPLDIVRGGTSVVEAVLAVVS